MATRSSRPCKRQALTAGGNAPRQRRTRQLNSRTRRLSRENDRQVDRHRKQHRQGTTRRSTHRSNTFPDSGLLQTRWGPLPRCLRPTQLLGSRCDEIRLVATHLAQLPLSLQAGSHRVSLVDMACVPTARCVLRSWSCCLRVAAMESDRCHGSLALPRDACQPDRKPFPVGKRSLAPGDYEITCQNSPFIMTNISTLPKSDIVSDAA